MKLLNASDRILRDIPVGAKNIVRLGVNLNGYFNGVAVRIDAPRKIGNHRCRLTRRDRAWRAVHAVENIRVGVVDLLNVAREVVGRARRIE